MTDEFHKHEAMHMTFVFSDVFERHVVQSELVQAKSELLEKAEVIGDLLGELYQAIGRTEEQTK